jgi:uncharacterized protein (TIGR03083 family)
MYVKWRKAKGSTLTGVEYAEHVDAVEAAGDAFAQALRGANTDARVPSCPEWSLLDLTRHVWNLTGFWTHVLCDGTGRPKTPFDEMPDGDGDQLAGGYAALSGHLVAELRATSPDTPVYTWASGHEHAGFVARRMAHEIAIHRYDAQLAVGRPQPIAADVAADGIDEMFFIVDVFGPPAGCGDGQTVHLHGTDRGDEWMIAMTPEGLQVDRAHGKADMALRGAVSDLELALYDRPTVGPTERFGDEAALQAWYRAFTFG